VSEIAWSGQGYAGQQRVRDLDRVAHGSLLEFDDEGVLHPRWRGGVGGAGGICERGQ
jgi:hypothetical protein